MHKIKTSDKTNPKKKPNKFTNNTLILYQKVKILRSFIAVSPSSNPTGLASTSHQTPTVQIPEEVKMTIKKQM